MQLVDDGVNLALKRAHHIVMCLGVKSAHNAASQMTDTLTQRPVGGVNGTWKVQKALEDCSCLKIRA